MTYGEAETLLERIKSAWPTFKISEFSAREWHRSLERFPLSAINDAFEQLKYSSKYAPSIADFHGCLESQGITKARNYDDSKLTYYDGRKPFYIRDDEGKWKYAGLDSPENLIKFEGRNIGYVEYICEILGNKRTNELYREWMTEQRVPKDPKRMVQGFPVAKYKQFLADLMELAKQEQAEQVFNGELK